MTLAEKTTEKEEEEEACDGGVKVTAEEDVTNGKVTWKVHLPPGSEQALTAAPSVAEG